MKLLGQVFLGLLIIQSIREFQGDGFFLLDTVNFIFHEAGHPIFGIFGEFVGFLGGTLGQLLIPVMFGAYFFKNCQFFSSGIMLWWFGQNLIGIGTYVADARAQVLPIFANARHDWAYLLSNTGLLQYDRLIGGALQITGLIIMLASIGVLFFLLQQNERKKVLRNSENL